MTPRRRDAEEHAPRPVQELREQLQKVSEAVGPGGVGTAIARFHAIQELEKTILEDVVLAASPRTVQRVGLEAGFGLSQAQKIERRVIKRLLAILRNQRRSTT